VVAEGTRSGRAKKDRLSQEPQGADLCRAAGLGSNVRGHLAQPRRKGKRNEHVPFEGKNELSKERESQEWWETF
jgi:hypothetical protein